MSSDDEMVLKGAAAGMSIKKLAAQFGMSEDDVRLILDRAAATWVDPVHLRRELALEVARLGELQRHYFYRAMTDAEGSNAAGALYVKISERKSVLLGLNASTSSAVTVIHESSRREQPSAMDKIETVLAQLAGITPRERWLENRKHTADGLTDDEAAELAELQGERAAKANGHRGSSDSEPGEAKRAAPRS